MPAFRHPTHRKVRLRTRNGYQLINNKIYMSTPMGDNNAFYEMYKKAMKCPVLGTQKTTT